MSDNPNPTNSTATNTLSPTDEHGKLIQHTCEQMYVHKPKAPGAAPKEQTIKPDKPIKKRRATSGKAKAKARKAASLIVQGHTQATAMRQAGYSESAVHHRPPHDMELIRAETNCILDAAYPLQAMIDDLLAGLQATRFVVVPGGKGPATVIREPDFHARHKYFQTASQMRGLLVRDVKVTGTGPNGEIELSVALSAARQRLAQADIEVTSTPVKSLSPKPE